MWKPVDEITARWRPEEGEGLEHVAQPGDRAE
jgi:hypothetical protein